MVFRCASAILQLFESSADMRIAKLSILESLFLFVLHFVLPGNPVRCQV